MLKTLWKTTETNFNQTNLSKTSKTNFNPLQFRGLFGRANPVSQTNCKPNILGENQLQYTPWAKNQL